MTDRQRIVLTGGPCGGKTTFIQLAQRNFGSSMEVVEEAATLLYRGGFPRGAEILNRRCAQTAIYHVQRQLETYYFTRASEATLFLCDRGSLDGVAYWPGSTKDYLNHLNTHLEFEISRYDWVIHFMTASEDDYNAGNPYRTETYQEAKHLDSLIQATWSQHPRQVIIEDKDDFLNKMELALDVISAIQMGLSLNEIRQLVDRPTKE